MLATPLISVTLELSMGVLISGVRYLETVINPVRMRSRVTVVCLCAVCYRSICFTAEIYCINV